MAPTKPTEMALPLRPKTILGRKPMKAAERKSTKLNKRPTYSATKRNTMSKLEKERLKKRADELGQNYGLPLKQEFEQHDKPRWSKVEPELLNKQPAPPPFKNKSEEEPLYHAWYRDNGPKGKLVGEVIIMADPKKILALPADKVICDDNTDLNITEQMTAVIADGQLTPRRLGNLVRHGVEICFRHWNMRGYATNADFWGRIGGSEGWLQHLDGVVCRDFFLKLCVMYKNGSREEPTNQLTREVKRLYEKFEGEAELAEFIGTGVNLPTTANMFLGRRRVVGGRVPAGGPSGVRFNLYGNMFQGMKTTNVSDVEYRQIAKSLFPISSLDEVNSQRGEAEAEARKAAEARKKKASSRSGIAHATPYEITNMLSSINMASTQDQASKPTTAAGEPDDLTKEMENVTISSNSK